MDSEIKILTTKFFLYKKFVLLYKLCKLFVIICDVVPFGLREKRDEYDEEKCFSSWV